VSGSSSWVSIRSPDEAGKGEAASCRDPRVQDEPGCPTAPVQCKRERRCQSVTGERRWLGTRELRELVVGQRLHASPSRLRTAPAPASPTTHAGVSRCRDPELKAPPSGLARGQLRTHFSVRGRSAHSRPAVGCRAVLPRPAPPRPFFPRAAPSARSEVTTCSSASSGSQPIARFEPAIPGSIWIETLFGDLCPELAEVAAADSLSAKLLEDQLDESIDAGFEL